MTTTEWPSHAYEVRPWKSQSRRGPREDRMLTEVLVSIPPFIAHLDYAVPADLERELDNATRDIVALDSSHGDRLASLGRLLIRTEAVASSKIEYIEADIRDYARAVAGIRSNSSALSMVDATRALESMVDEAGRSSTIALEVILDAHKRLMADDPFDGPEAGRLRRVQNWIGGSDHTPRGAIHVPPPPDAVPGLMADLLSYASRTDVPALVQAAIVHLQFESIHPFTDGNGRVGRALINAVLRRRGITSSTVVPLASAMLARRDRYFELVNVYRSGSVTPFVRALVDGSRLVCHESSVSALALEAMPPRWRASVRPRSGSALAALLDGIRDHAILGVEEAAAFARVSESAAYRAMETLEAAAIIEEVTDRKRNRVWAVIDVMDELADLDERIAEAARTTAAARASTATAATDVRAAATPAQPRA